CMACVARDNEERSRRASRGFREMQGHRGAIQLAPAHLHAGLVGKEQRVCLKGHAANVATSIENARADARGIPEGGAEYQERRNAKRPASAGLFDSSVTAGRSFSSSPPCAARCDARNRPRSPDTPSA